MNQAAMMKIKKMQKEMMENQKRIEETVFTGKAGGGMVSVEVTGSYEVKKVTIDKDAFESKEDIEMIEDSIQAAFNDAFKQISEETEKSMGAFSGMPGLGGLF